MLTARGEEIDRVVGFELGADDYITKPFSVRELVLRVRAVLRRKVPTSSDAPTIEFGNLRIDRAAHRVWVDGSEVELTALEFKLLVTLYDRRNPRAVARVSARLTRLGHRGSHLHPHRRRPTSNACAKKSAQLATTSKPSAASATVSRMRPWSRPAEPRPGSLNRDPGS